VVVKAGGTYSYQFALKSHFDDGGSTHLWNVGLLQIDYTALYNTRHWSLCSRRWAEPTSLNCGHYLAHCSSPTLYMSMGNRDRIILTWKNWRTRRKICPSTTLSTTNPTWSYPGGNSGLHGERPATNRLNHGTVIFKIKKQLICKCQVILIK
jgi:hypothetical protein